MDWASGGVWLRIGEMEVFPLLTPAICGQLCVKTLLHNDGSEERCVAKRQKVPGWHKPQLNSFYDRMNIILNHRIGLVTHNLSCFDIGQFVTLQLSRGGIRMHACIHIPTPPQTEVLVMLVMSHP